MRNDQLWHELQEVLKHRHIESGDDALASVNRLLRKKERVKQTVSSLQLHPKRAEIAGESWKLPKLMSLIAPSQVTNDRPAAESGAVVIVRCEPFAFLVDGRRRINHWARISALGPYRALVLWEVQGDSGE